MVFCSSKFDDFPKKLNSLVTTVNVNTKRIEVESKFTKMKEEIYKITNDNNIAQEFNNLFANVGNGISNISKKKNKF